MGPVLNPNITSTWYNKTEECQGWFSFYGDSDSLSHFAMRANQRAGIKT